MLYQHRNHVKLNVMTFVLKNYLPTTYGQVHYRHCGNLQDGSVPLVLLHQTASASVMYEAMMRLLAPQIVSFAPDTPGYGMSFDPMNKPSIKFYTQVLKECLEQLKIETCYLFGHHTGAAIAVQLAHDYPELAQGLILSGPPYLTHKQKQRLKATLPEGKFASNPDYYAKVWQRISSRSLTQDPELIHRETLLTLRATGYAQTYEAVFEQDFAKQLPSITCPTRIICGDQDTIHESAEPTHQAIQHSSLSIITNAGTYLCDENPKQVVSLIQDFIFS